MGRPTHGKGLWKRSLDFVRLVLIENFGYRPEKKNVFEVEKTEILRATVRQKPKLLSTGVVCAAKFANKGCLLLLIVGRRPRQAAGLCATACFPHRWSA